ncbi:MAG: NPCBM/NEW2 domain-containing protein [Planctomycetaceae bacterium]|nr:NPCBM/NEW2 domain-containing protein [Planctomycetaceae bacterium]
MFESTTANAKALLFAGTLSCVWLAAACTGAETVKPAAQSALVTTAVPGYSRKLEADISGAKNLYLVVTDGGNGFSCDWADWVEPTLTGPKGTLRLTSLRWKSAESQWGQTAVGRNANGGPLSIHGKTIADGIGTHANSVIHFEIPEGYTKFTATVGLDNGGTDQGDAPSVQFAVYTQPPPRSVTSGGNGQSREPEDAVTSLDVAEGLEARLFAAEPMMFSPSNIDVDHLGRVWVCEVVNYRHFANQNNPAREAGDRIIVLEDTDGDAVADKLTTFYQGREIDSAHGVCVLGNRVIVSAGENVFSFYDDDGDLKADRKEVMFTGIKGVQHDHGIHSFTFGPDGRLYFNFGNNGEELHHPDGSIVTDLSGNEVRHVRKPYQEGMAFRCELDGSRVDTLGWNFRNNWELCVDSFGTIWQSDNDDDGNRGVRINFVMEYGNYGYKDEFTGAGWREPRTGWEQEIPHRHWHLNDPGVVPNLLQTGAGSPTGILCYEGSLLPERFRNQLIHCDAGPNVVRSYSVTADGAGYKAEVNDILNGTRDQWFRPSDVCAAPDGSLFVADWYDPGVGGHRQGDVERGRLFRVAPPKTAYRVQKPDLHSIAGAAEALKSPNVATRYLAFQKLKSAGADAESVLGKLFADDPNPRFRARALWLLGQIDGRGRHWVETAIADDNSDIRITGVRLARRIGLDVAAVVAQLVRDPSPQVRRECAVALRHCASADKAALWGQLAVQLPSHDRWYLEALGIAADSDWDHCLEGFQQALAATDTDGGEIAGSLVWRSRGSQSAKAIIGQVEKLATGPNVDDAAKDHILTYFRALDFQPAKNTAAAAASLLKPSKLNKLNDKLAPVIVAESLQRLNIADFASNPDAQAALEKALTDLQGTAQFIQLVERFQLESHYPELLLLAQQKPADQVGVEAIRSLQRNKQWRLLSAALKGEDRAAAVATAQVMGNSLDGAIAGVLMSVITDGGVAVDVRREAVRAVSQVNNGAKNLGELVEQKQLAAELSDAAAAALHAAPSRSTREIAMRLFPLPPGKEGKPLPPITEFVERKGDVANGRLIFNTTGTCHKCHIVNKIGRDVGPDLSEIGSKLSRQALFESILYPSAGISHNYESWTVLLTSGTAVTGLLTSETDDSISIKPEDGLVRTFARSEVEEQVKQKISLMPADLQKVMTEQEIVDVVDYLQTLKKQ